MDIYEVDLHKLVTIDRGLLAFVERDFLIIIKFVQWKHFY